MSDSEFRVTEGARVRRAAAAKAYPIGDEDLVVYLEGHDVLHALNASAWAVWDMCDGDRTLGEMAGLLAEETGLPVDRILADVLAIVSQLIELGLLEPA